MKRLLTAIALLALAVTVFLYAGAQGWLGTTHREGEITGPARDVAVAVASLSDAATRRLSCRAASVFAWVMSRSTSPSSTSIRCSSSRKGRA